MLADVVIHTFDTLEGTLLDAVRSGLEERFNVRATLGAELTLPVEAYSHERGQYSSTTLLNELANHRRSDERVKLGITDVDLFVPDLNFVFGEASKARRAAVFSTARLDPCVYGEQRDDALLKRRALTEAVHELGHVYGLDHCERQDCVMWFSNTLTETDRKGSRFCPVCVRALGLTD